MRGIWFLRLVRSSTPAGKSRSLAAEGSAETVEVAEVTAAPSPRTSPPTLQQHIASPLKPAEKTCASLAEQSVCCTSLRVDRGPLRPLTPCSRRVCVCVRAVQDGQARWSRPLRRCWVGVGVDVLDVVEPVLGCRLWSSGGRGCQSIFHCIALRCPAESRPTSHVPPSHRPTCKLTHKAVWHWQGVLRSVGPDGRLSHWSPHCNLHSHWLIRIRMAHGWMEKKSKGRKRGSRQPGRFRELTDNKKSLRLLPSRCYCTVLGVTTRLATGAYSTI